MMQLDIEKGNNHFFEKPIILAYIIYAVGCLLYIIAIIFKMTYLIHCRNIFSAVLVRGIYLNMFNNALLKKIRLKVVIYLGIISYLSTLIGVYITPEASTGNEVYVVAFMAVFNMFLTYLILGWDSTSGADSQNVEISDEKPKNNEKKVVLPKKNKIVEVFLIIIMFFATLSLSASFILGVVKYISNN